jgi:hypothetical protein
LVLGRRTHSRGSWDDIIRPSFLPLDHSSSDAHLSMRDWVEMLSIGWKPC